jgi:hypothetical protein
MANQAKHSPFKKRLEEIHANYRQNDTIRPWAELYAEELQFIAESLLESHDKLVEALKNARLCGKDFHWGSDPDENDTCNACREIKQALAEAGEA